MLDIADNHVYTGDTLYICGSPNNSKHRRLLKSTVLEVSDKKATVIIHESGRVREVTKATSILPHTEEEYCLTCATGTLYTYVESEQVTGKWGESILYTLVNKCACCDNVTTTDKYNQLNLKLKEHAGLL